MDQFLGELEKISTVDAEGEAGVYFTAAITLRDTIACLRGNPSLQSPGLDLVRCESLQSLDQNTLARLLHKNYSLLVCMAPLTHQLRVLGSPSLCPPVLGPGLPEVASSWFKLYLYHLCGQGPPSLLIPKGYKMRCLPQPLSSSTTLLVTTWGHEATEVPTLGALSMLQDALLHSPVLLQLFSSHQQKAQTRHIAFPVQGDLGQHFQHVLRQLGERVDLTHTCGYITLVNFPRKHEKLATQDINYGNPKPLERQGSPAGEALDSSTAQLLEEEIDNIDSPMAGEPTKKAKRPTNLKLSVETTHDIVEEWKLLDISYGVPLFDTELNAEITDRIVKGGLVSEESLANLCRDCEQLKEGLLEFIKENTDSYSSSIHAMLDSNEVPYPTKPVWYDGIEIRPMGHIFNK